MEHRRNTVDTGVTPAKVCGRGSWTKALAYCWKQDGMATGVGGVGGGAIFMIFSLFCGSKALE